VGDGARRDNDAGMSAARPDDRARRIGIVTDTYPPEINGVALTLARLTGGLRARGRVVTVVRPRQGRADAETLGDDTILVRGVQMPGYRAVRIGLPAGRVLREAWRRRPPDAVYVATPGPLGLSAVSVARRLGIAVYTGFHTNFPEYARHYHLGALATVGMRGLRWFHNRSRGTLVASAELLDELAAAGVRDLHVLGRGVDGALFTPARRSAALRARWGATDGELVVLHVGRLAAEKNIPVAIDAFRAIQRVGAGARLVIVGDGPVRRELERGAPEAVFCGMRTGEDLATHYASADVFLFPSETETFGNVTLEAMASGLAVVAYDYAAAALHVDSGASGVLAPRTRPRSTGGTSSIASRPCCWAPPLSGLRSPWTSAAAR
jgi:glycosyltransferase involved in cell wall biosynthesis